MPTGRGQLEILADLNEIAGPAGRARLEPQAMAVLQLLAAEPGRVWSRDELLDSAWPERVVSDATLTGVISRLRAALVSAGVRDVRIETRSKRGYVLVEILADARRKPWKLAVATVVLLVIPTALLMCSLMSSAPLQSLEGVRLDFEISSSDGTHVAPAIWLRDGTEGSIRVGGDQPLDLRVIPTLDARGLIRLRFEANSLSHWAGFDHVIGLDTENVFSIKAGNGNDLFRVQFTASAHDSPPVP